MTVNSSPKNVDLVTLVNESDEVIGSMDKIEAHRGEATLHRCVSVYLFKPDSKELLIQQRAAVKIVGAHQWANTICGNVRPTENYEECALRRLKEELGITDVIVNPIYKFQYHLRCNEEFSEWEMDQVFFGWYGGEVKPNPDEAQDYLFIDWEGLKDKEKKAQLLTTEFHTKIVTNAHRQQSLRLTPWFVWMLNDPQLISLIDKQLS